MMNPTELLRGVEAIQREKNISKEIIFEAIESAVQLATEKFYGEEEEVIVTLDRDSGVIHARRGEEVIDPQELGRIAAQAAKQAMIQKLREGECNAVFNIYAAKKGDLVHGTVQRFEGGAATVTIDRSETLLPRSEQIPGETHHVGERVKAIILDVRKVGHRVKIILSRTHPDFVRRLFEMEIPEIADRTIEIKAVAREAGYRSKVAVSSIDLKVDCVGACVGVRGSRIKNIVDELAASASTSSAGTTRCRCSSPTPSSRRAWRKFSSTRAWDGPSCSSRKTSCRWPSAAAAKMSAWRRNSSAGTSRS